VSLLNQLTTHLLLATPTPVIADIRHTEYDGNDVLLRARLAPRAAKAYEEFRVD
jgi:hypothetical protein